MSHLQATPARSRLRHRLAPHVLPAAGCLVVGAALLASRLLTGAPTADTTAPAPSPATADLAVDYRDPAAVCAAFAKALHLRDTTTDSGPADAYRRAAAYADARYTAALADPNSLRLPDWQQWLDHRAAVAVDVQALAGDVDTDQDGHRIRAVEVTTTARGRDGWIGPTLTTHVICDLAPAPEGWRVGSYTLQVTR